jgi:hypothetical protein
MKVMIKEEFVKCPINSCKTHYLVERQILLIFEFVCVCCLFFYHNHFPVIVSPKGFSLCLFQFCKADSLLVLA